MKNKIGIYKYLNKNIGIVLAKYIPTFNTYRQNAVAMVCKVL